MRRATELRRWAVALILALTLCGTTAGSRTAQAQEIRSAATRPVPGRVTATRSARPLSMAVVVPVASAPASQPAPAGVRFKLKTVGDAFVPAYLERGLRQVDLLVHFHGAPSVVEREFAAAGLRGVLVCINYGGLSGTYAKPFADTKLFGAVLDETMASLKERKLVAADAAWRHVCVSSFSAGFGAVRAVLKVPAYFDRIDALYLADTLYAGYLGDPSAHKVNPGDVKDFCRFAADAAAGRKTLIVTHTYLEPGTYAGTHETAENLIAAAGATRRAVDEPGAAGMRIISRADRGRFHLWGCEGKTGQDHMAHLRNMRFWLPNLPLDRAAPQELRR